MIPTPFVWPRATCPFFDPNFYHSLLLRRRLHHNEECKCNIDDHNSIQIKLMVSMPRTELARKALLATKPVQLLELLHPIIGKLKPCNKLLWAMLATFLALTSHHRTGQYTIPYTPVPDKQPDHGHELAQNPAIPDEVQKGHPEEQTAHTKLSSSSSSLEPTYRNRVGNPKKGWGL